MEPTETTTTETEPQGASAAPTKRERSATPKNKAVVDTNRQFDPWSNLDKAPDELAGAEAGFDYRYQPMRDFPSDGIAADDWRNKMAALGFEPCNGPRRSGPALPVYHPSQPTAEIWRRPIGFAEQEWLVQLAENITREFYYTHYKQHPSMGQVLPEELRQAMFAFHDKTRAPEDKPTKAEIRQLVRELVKVHPGNPPPRRWQSRRR